MDFPKITKIELFPVFVPFREEIQAFMNGGQGGLGMAISAEEPWPGGDFLLCRLAAEDGSTGIGEVFVWLPETGTTPSDMVSTITHSLGKYIIGESPFNIEKINYRMDVNVARCEVAKGLLDMACYSLMGSMTGRPVYDLIGGRSVDTVALTALIPLSEPDTMLSMGKYFLDIGYRSFRIKLGAGITRDIVTVKGFRDLLGDNGRLRVDYNQAYTPDDAVRAINAIAPYGIDCAEQPVRSTDYLGMAYVQSRVTTPLMSHEGCFSVKDYITLTEMGAVRVLGINSERPGGLSKALKVINYAEARGMGVILHNQPLGISSAMQLHLACCRYHSLGHAPELFGHIMLEDDLITDPINYHEGSVTVPTGPGWGVILDEDALSRFMTCDPIILQ